MSHPAPDEISVTPRRDSRVARALTVIFGCIAGMLVLLAIILVLYPAFAPSHGEGYRPYTCISNGKQLGYALRMYMSDYDDKLPAAGSWGDDLFPYVKNTQVYVCPQRPGSPGFAFNSRLDRRSEGTLSDPAATPALFESFRGMANAADPLQSFVTPHAGKGVVGFVDGHVRWLPGAPSATAGLKDGKR